jgi:hypothetical protein
MPDPPKPNAIQILTTLEYLGKYNGSSHFGLILQVGLGPTAAGNPNVKVDATMANLLQPWMWRAPGSGQPATPPPGSPLQVTAPQIKVWKVAADALNPQTPRQAAPAPPGQVVATPVPTAANPAPAAATPAPAVPNPPPAVPNSDAVKEVEVDIVSVSGSIDPSITNQLSLDCTAAIGTKDDGNNLTWTDPINGANNGHTVRGDGKNMYPWPAHLAQVARYPYPIPHLLNLCFFLKVKDESALPKAEDDSSTPPVKADVVFATVAFTANVNSSPTTYSPQVANRFLSPDGRLVVIPASSDSTVFITTNPLKVPQGGLQPAATVIAPAQKFTPETTNWQTQFPAGTADVFDLSARLVNSVRKACDPPPETNPPDPSLASNLKTAVAANFTAYTVAVITAQREIVAYGCQVGPNGKSLLNRLLDSWVAGGGDRSFATRFGNAVNARRNSEIKDIVAANNRWLALLKSNPAFLNDPLIPLTPGITLYNSQSTYKKGDIVIQQGYLFTALRDPDASHPLQVLAGAVPNTDWSSFNPPSALTAILVSNLPDRLIAVEHLQLQFAQASVLIQLLVAQWQNVYDDPPGAASPFNPGDGSSLQSFLSSSSAMLADLDVRGLLLQCNLGNPVNPVNPVPSSWKLITADLSSRDTIRTNFSKELQRRINALFNLPPKIPPPTVISTPLWACLQPWVDQRLTTLVPNPLNTTTSTNAAPPTDAPTDNPRATRASEGLSVLVDSLDDHSAKDESDSLRSISGLCVLMRQSGDPNHPNPWRCLDAGIPIANLASTTSNPYPPAITNSSDTRVIPVPLHNQDGLRQATLTYNNQPLMSRSPAHIFSDGLVPKQKSSGNSDRLISFQHPSVTQGLDPAELEQWKIPGLAFNHSYDFLLGSISNSGALPPAFADPAGGPGVLNFSAINPMGGDGKPAPSPFPATIPGVPYRRTVPIADLRFYSSFSGDGSEGSSPDSGSFDKLRLPPIPDDVHPRAQEVYLSAAAVASTGSTPDKPTTPLVMLTPYAVATPTTAPAISKFTLSVRKPTTDFLTWDRTQAALDHSAPGTNSKIRQDRVNAWELFHRFARSEKSNYNLALEDPAIGSLTLSVSAIWSPNKLTGNPDNPIGPNGSDITLSWADARISDPTGPPPLKPPTSIQSVTPSIDIEITASQGLTTPSIVKSSSSKWTVTLPPGSIAQIQLTPNLKPNMDQHFAAGILPDKPKAYRILVETACADLPQRDDLYKAFNVFPSLTPASNTVNFSLTAPANSPAWLQVSRVDLLTQVWRWDGRPFQRFPFSDVARIPYDNTAAPIPKQTFTDKLSSWELETYTTRTVSDSTARPMTRIKASNPTFEAQDDRGTELGATYYRAAVTAYNRYGSLVPDTVISKNNPLVALKARSCSTLNEVASIPGMDGNWMRRFIPARMSADASVPAGFVPPKPAIKYIVPLTGASTVSEPAASSALVVVQGPWFAIAGLAEDICATITTSSPKVSSIDPPPIPEAGPDPILYTGTKLDLPKTFEPYGSPFTPPDADPHFHGPVGHTFDISDVNPLWVTTSFVLDPPASNGNAAQEGTFARIQFARKICKEGVVVQKAASTDAKGSTVPASLMPSNIDFDSNATDPVWIQFLPSRFFPNPKSSDRSLDESFDNLTLNYNSGTITVNPQGDKNPITLNLNQHSIGTSNLSHLAYGLLITQLVPDLLGRPNQERFVDLPLLEPSSGGQTAASWSFKIPPGVPPTDLIGRIVVIQRQVGTSLGCDSKNQSKSQPPCDLTTTKELWCELFPPAPQNAQFSDDDAMARIIAVSPLIPAGDSPTPNQSCEVDKTYAAGD